MSTLRLLCVYAIALCPFMATASNGIDALNGATKWPETSNHPWVMPSLLADTIDNDNDGFFADVDPFDLQYDPNDNHPCIPFACSPTCDFDLDGLVNQNDPDDDNDGCPDFYDSGACDPHSEDLLIQSTSLCPGASGCESACENSSVTYSIDNPEGHEVVWYVEGAAAYGIQGDEVAVDWGAAGNGKVKASFLPDNGIPVLECGQAIPATGPGKSDGIAFIQTHILPTVFDVSFDDGTSWQHLDNFKLENLAPGDYDIWVRNPDKPLGKCSFTITTSPGFDIIALPISDNCNQDGLKNYRFRGFRSDFYNNNTFEYITHPWQLKIIDLINSDTVSMNGNSGFNTGFYQLLAPGQYRIIGRYIPNNITISQDLVVSCDASCSQSGEICVKIQPDPIAKFSTSPLAPNGQIDLCKSESIQFVNESAYSSTVIWDFGDGTSSALEKPLHTFNQAGNYEVKLIARNSCFCSDTTAILIHVEDAEIPEILCGGPICAGDSTTYTANVVCSEYHWNISSNGILKNGGGISDNYVTVLWKNGTKGTVELTVSGCTTSVCDKHVNKEISIIAPQSTIYGPSSVCSGELVEYYIDPQEGSEIIWKMPSLATLVKGQGSNKITVQWKNYSNIFYTDELIKVSYDNCFLGCSGEGSLSVLLKANYLINGPTEVCQGSSPNFKCYAQIESQSLSANWSILDTTGAVIWTKNSASTIAPVWNFPPGTYYLKAVSTLPFGCLDGMNMTILVLPQPEAPAIEGPASICPNNTFTYTASSNLSDATFSWQINDGGIISQKTGKNINVQWGSSPPYQLVLRQTDFSGPGCLSLADTLDVQTLQPFTISGQATACKEASATYSTAFFQNIKYEWQIEPTDAGSILSGQGSSNVEVFWQKPGGATLTVRICDEESNFVVQVVAPNPTEVIHPDTLCENATSLVQTTHPFESFQWINSAGQSISTDAMPALYPGSYRVETTDMLGCKGNTIFTIQALPAPVAKIVTETYEGGICGFEVPLHAVQTTSTNFQWYKNGEEFGTNSPLIYSGQEGEYYVAVTNEFGCISNSNTAKLIECTQVGGHCVDGKCLAPGATEVFTTHSVDSIGMGAGCSPIGTISYTWSNLTCDQVQFTNTSTNFFPNTVLWYYREEIISHEVHPLYSFPTAGFYRVYMEGLVMNGPISTDTCGGKSSALITVPLRADFAARETCLGLPTIFNDLSTFLPDAGIASWEWDFGDPSSGNQNISALQHPTHIYNEAGEYTVTLAVTASTGCISTFSKNIIVHGYPTVSFGPPTANCAAVALGFSADASPDAVLFNWEFGDPANGEGNFSIKKNPTHTYPEAGNYTVTVTAASVYGCSATYTDEVGVEANNLSGTISPENPPISCEGIGVDLSAPAGGVEWLWSNGAAGSSINATETGEYSVSLTNAQGCTYSAPPVSVDIIEGPVATIRAVELNEFGQPVAYHSDGYSACEGNDVFLEMNGNIKYSYEWSNGITGDQLSLASANGSLLPAGIHEFSVTVTDLNTGCTSVEGPFAVTVHGAPTSVSINAEPPGPICDGMSAVFTIDDPQPDVTYLWNTGQMGNYIDAIAAGTYLVQATNQFGCVANSNSIEIYQAPQLANISTGCFTICGQKEFCLPEMPEVAAFQWFYQGDAVPAPEGTVKDFFVAENGDYYVEMTSIYGCISTSDNISIQIEEPIGDIVGNVWLDLNFNNTIDYNDSLLTGIDVLLVQNGNIIGQASSQDSSGFVFPLLPANEYEVIIDSSALSLEYDAVIAAVEAPIVDCWDTVAVKLLLKTACQNPVFNEINLSACEGNSAIFNGTSILAGQSKDFIFPLGQGCDSTVTVFVETLPTSSEHFAFQSCGSLSVEFMGEMLLPGETASIVLQNQYGCDSILTAEVTALPISTGFMEISSCPGIPVEYMGEMLMPGQQEDFILQNQFGCDSLLTVIVVELPSDTASLVLESCPNQAVEFMGEMLMPGQQKDFILQNQFGCDSLLTVIVNELAADFTQIEMSSCPGVPIEFLGQIIMPGEMDTLILKNQFGCDSLVEIYVVELEQHSTQIAMQACPGDSIFFNNEILQAGEQQEFILQNQFGCDSVVTVTVTALLADTIYQEIKVCQGETVEINGETLHAGNQYIWSGTNLQGCDSSLVIQVSEWPAASFELLSQGICPGENGGRILLHSLTGTPPLLTSLDGENFDDKTEFNQLPLGSYTIWIKDGNNCQYSTPIDIDQMPPLEVAEQDYYLSCTDPYFNIGPRVISSAGDVTWLWQDGSTNRSFEVTEPGIYSFQISDDCSTKDYDVNVYWGDNLPADLLYIPNVFSPNGDGVNDTFKAYPAASVEILFFEMHLFNRWGGMVYEGIDIQNGWNGRLGGKLMDPGVFVWKISAIVRICGQTTRIAMTGDVALMR